MLKKGLMVVLVAIVLGVSMSEFATALLYPSCSMGAGAGNDFYYRSCTLSFTPTDTAGLKMSGDIDAPRNPYVDYPGSSTPMNGFYDTITFTPTGNPFINGFLKVKLTDDTGGCIAFTSVSLKIKDTAGQESEVSLWPYTLLSYTPIIMCNIVPGEQEYPDSHTFQLDLGEGKQFVQLDMIVWNSVSVTLTYPEAWNYGTWYNDEKYIIEWATAPDADHDGQPVTEDCNDGDPTVYKGAPEICDGKANNQHWHDSDLMDECGIDDNYEIDAGCDGDGDGYCSASKNVSLFFLETCKPEDGQGCCKNTLEWYKRASGQETGSLTDVYNALLAHDESLKIDASIKNIPITNKLFRAASKDFEGEMKYFARGNDCRDALTNVNPGAAEKCYNQDSNEIDDNCNAGSSDQFYGWDNDEDTGINEFCEDKNSQDCEHTTYKSGSNRALSDYHWVGLYGYDDGACCGNNVYEITGTSPGYQKTTEFFPYWTQDMAELLLPDEYSGCWDSRAVQNNDVAGVNLFSTADYYLRTDFSNNAVLPLDEVNVTYGEDYTFYTNMSLGGGPGGIARLRYLEKSLSCKIPENDLYTKDDFVSFSVNDATMNATRKERSGYGPSEISGTNKVFTYNYTTEYPMGAFTFSATNPRIIPYPGTTFTAACRDQNNQLSAPTSSTFAKVADSNRKIKATITCGADATGYVIGQVNLYYKTSCNYIDRDGDGLNVCNDRCGEIKEYKCVCDLPYLHENEVVDTGLNVKSGEGRGVVMRNYTPSNPSVKQAVFEVYIIGVPEIDLKETKFYKTEDAKVLNVNGTFRGCDIPMGSWFLRQINTFNPAPPDNNAILQMYNFKHDDMDDDNCTVSSDYFCSLDGRWKRNVDGIEANNISSIPEAESGLLQDGGYWKDFYLEADCCPTSYCWDGFKCNNGYHGFVGVHIINASVGEDNELRDYKCVDGEWQRAYWKTDQDNFTMGYCGEYQCLYRPPDGSAKLCVNDGNYTFDDYCFIGSWSSRTNMIAKRLLNLTEGKGDYVLFCDSFENALNDYDYTDPVVGDVLEYIVGKRTTTATDTGVQLFDCSFGEWSGAAGEGFGCTNNFCVLRYNNNGEPKVVFGTSLNFPINTTNEDFRFALSFLRLFDAVTRNIIPQDADHYTYCDGAISQQNSDYLGCDGPYTYKENIDWELWYNAKTQSIIYSPVKVNLGDTSTWDSFIEFVKKPFTSIINSILSIPREKYYRRDYSFVSSIGKFRRLYMNANFDGSSLGRAVKGVVETVGSETGMVVDYYKIGVDICNKVEEYNRKYCPNYGDVPKEYIPELCPLSCEPMVNEDGWSFHIESNDPDGIMLWPEMTAKIRINGMIENGGTLEQDPEPQIYSYCKGEPCEPPFNILVPITFNASVKDTKDIIAYTWDFGDNTVFGTPYADEALPVQHTYISSGPYTVTFRMMDKSFRVYQTTKNIQIDKSDEGGPCTTDDDCSKETSSKMYCNPEGRCSIQNCTDGWKNQDEVDVDCGGGCISSANGWKRCLVGQDCDNGDGNENNDNSTCMSDVCFDGTCMYVENACTVGTFCQPNEGCLFSMTDYINSHAHKDCPYGNYKMCCREYRSADGGTKILGLAGQDELEGAAVEEPSQTNYADGIYIAGGTTCRYREGSCHPNEECIAGISAETAANVSSCDDFWGKICCPLPKFYDYFGGDNIDVKKWISTPGEFTIRQENGKLIMSKGAGGAQDANGLIRGQIASKTILSGNFVIEMNYTLLSFPTPTSGLNQLQLEVNDGAKTLLVSRQKWKVGGAEKDGYSTWDIQTSTNWALPLETGGTDSGKMRLNRIGTNLYASYSPDGGATWTQIASASISANPVTFTIALQNNQNGDALNARIDDMVVY